LHPHTPQLLDYASVTDLARLRAGTSGYSYKEWKGPFYPDKMKPADMLAFYAGKLPAVEINNTFYRMPKKTVVESWAEQVPEDFRFAIKASRRITHFKRLKETEEETGFLLGNLEVLGDRLGVVLFQLPPNLKCDVSRLENFLALLPEGLPAAFEFRHGSWRDEAVHQRLRDRNFAIVAVDAEDAERPELISTASWAYLRLRRPDYDRAALADWALEIARNRAQEAFVFFKHEDEGAGPRMALAFLEAAAETRGKRKSAASGSRRAQAV
jgi:uncharacterized protein YecE (DUF72 family)